MGSEILRLENRTSNDRRQNSIPVENDRRCGVDRRLFAKFQSENGNKIDIHHGALVSAMDTISPVRRLTCISDDIQKGEYAAAAGLAGLALINSTSDIDDIKESYKQVKSMLVKSAEFEHAYDHTIAQHPFSFFRGTLLHRLLDKIRKINPEFAQKIVSFDNPFVKTNLGKKIMKYINVEKIDSINTTIKSFNHTGINPKYIRANVYKGGFFGKLTARAMERTTIIGLGVMAAFELPKIIKSMKKGDNVFEKTENTAKQTAKSAINVASLTAGIGYFGALGSKMHGNIGSLFGIGIGAMAGSYVSEKVQDLISLS